MTTKICTKCAQSKPHEDFYKTGRKTDKDPDKRHSVCKTCTIARLKKNYNPETYRRQHLRRKYDISLEEYNEMLLLQGGNCAVCHAAEAGGKHNVFVVDHDHVTGKVRELLCKDCNIVLGLVKDSPEHIGRLLAYIIKHNHD